MDVGRCLMMRARLTLSSHNLITYRNCEMYEDVGVGYAVIYGSEPQCGLLESNSNWEGGRLI